MRVSQMPFGRALMLSVFLLVVHPLAADETYKLDEPITDARVYSVMSRVEVEGQLETPAHPDGPERKRMALKLKAGAALGYRERRLSGTGRNAEAFRSLRFYDEAEARIAVNRNITSVRLPDDRRLVVAQGERDGTSVYSPSGPLTYRTLDLLKTPADSLAVLALLPEGPVTVGQKWTPPSWGVQMLTGTDAVVKSELTCRLESVTDETARVEFDGKLEGANNAATTEITLAGHYLYDLKRGHLKSLELEQTEQASAGPVAPALDVTARVVLNRRVADDAGPLGASVANRIPLDPDPSLLHLRFDSPWGVRFHYDRGWHLFHRTGEVAVLRLLDQGNFIAQLNVSKITDAEPGGHTSEEQFQREIGEALGEHLKKIEKAERLETKDGRFLYRVTATGEVPGGITDGGKPRPPSPMTWIYYLCAGPSGRQVSLVFAVETELLEKLDDRDVKIVSGLEFLDPASPDGARRVRPIR